MRGQVRRGLGRHAAAALIEGRVRVGLGGLHLDVDAQRRRPRACALSCGLEPVCQLARVHGLDADQRRTLPHERLHLVQRELTDEAPPGILRQVRPLADELVDIVLAKVTLTRVVRRLHCPRRFGLGHSNESWWRCAGESRGVSEALLHREQAVSHVGASESRRLCGHPSREREP